MAKSPVHFASARLESVHGPTALTTSELALDVERLAGRVPLAPLPEPAPVAPPDVLDAAFWAKTR
jgi:hypothetical protein